MKLILNRNILTNISTIGELFIDEVKQPRECWTLEVGYRDPQRPKGAIPPGVYEIQMLYSPHFAKEMPHLLNVPNFSFIMIHPANWPHQLLGCIAVGTEKERDEVDNSGKAFNALLPKILDGLKVGKVFIDIRGGVTNV